MCGISSKVQGSALLLLYNTGSYNEIESQTPPCYTHRSCINKTKKLHYNSIKISKTEIEQCRIRKHYSKSSTEKNKLYYI